MRAAFSAYIEPARRYPQLWRLAAGLVLIAGIYTAWIFGFTAAFGFMAPAGDGPAAARLWERLAGADDPAAMLLLLASFGGLALATIGAAALFHRRGLKSLLGPLDQLWRDFLVAALVVGIGGGALVLLLSQSIELRPGLETQLWLWVLPLALMGIAVQSLAEELLFRAYLPQQLAVRFRSPLVWIGLPAVVFALLHLTPGSSGLPSLAMVGAVFFLGLILADLTRRSGGLGAAWGMHFANNCLALLVLSTSPSLAGLALFHLPNQLTQKDLALVLSGELAVLLICWAALAFRHRNLTSRSQTRDLDAV